MQRSNWLHGLRKSPQKPPRRTRHGHRIFTASRRSTFELLEDRSLLAVLTVNSALDNNTPGDGLVTLREAIIAANNNTVTDLGQTGSGADTIQFDAAVFATPQTVSLVFGELNITESLTINGPGRDVLTVDAEHKSRVFNITATSGNYTFRGLTITRGMTSGQGGAIRSEPSSDFDWTLTVDQCTVSNSNAAGHGGGIFANSILTVTNSNITGNNATGANSRGGGFYVARFRTVTVSGSTIAENTAAHGGGFIARADLNLSDSTVRDNVAIGYAGGFWVIGLPTSGRGKALLNNATVTGNSATGFAGGFRASYATVNNSTITNNSVVGSAGGISITHRSDLSNATESLVLVDSVVSGNSATVSGGGIQVEYDARITDSVISNNTGGGIFTKGVILNSSTVIGNMASGHGGGIRTESLSRPRSSGNVVLNSSTVQGNTSATNGGGIYTTRGNITLNSSTVSGNQANAGGGVMSRHHSDFIYRGDVFLNSSTVTGNQSATSGGGIYAGDVTLNSSTVSGNKAMTAGGGIYSRAGNVSLLSSTVSGNEAMTAGGGIYSQGVTSIRHSTVARNQVVSGTGGGLWNGDGSVEIAASILADNSAGGGSPDLRPGSGTLTAVSSLIGDKAGTSLVEAQTPDANGNFIGNSAGGGAINPRLAALANNGGPTQTHALLAGSPAIDAIPYPNHPAPAHDYQLNNSLADAKGGPGLVAGSGTLTASGYQFGPNQGLSVFSAFANPSQYSIEILFRWDNLSGGLQKIIDFDNLTMNEGLYSAGNGLHFFNAALASNVFTANTLYRLVLTRNDTTDVARAYINGAEVWNFVDTAGAAIFDGPNQILRLFQDDATTGHSEAQSGFVDLVRIYNQVLTQPEIASLDVPIPTNVLLFDQRGTPFERVRNGDGIGGAQIDIGAFELQEPHANTAPVFTSPSAANVAENTTTVMTVTATDANVPPQTLTFSIIGGADRAKFSITAAGALSFVAPPDFEAPTDAGTNNVYDVTVQADDGNGGLATQTVEVTVTPVNESAPVFTSPNTASVPENTTAVMTVTATDADLPPAALTFSLVALADSAKFSITPAGVLTFLAPPDFEAPTDADGDNVYVAMVQVSDGTFTNVQSISVTVTATDDNALAFTSPPDFSIVQGGVAVGTVMAEDADVPGSEITFSLVGGVDLSKFLITTGGLLTFLSPPSFAMPTDANGDNIYVVVVQASGAGQTATQTVSVRVLVAPLDFGDAPDAAPGTGSGNYHTRAADNGPRHTIVGGLRLGTAIDGDSGLLANSTATADDADGALPDDEDGVVNPAADLWLTAGTQPTVNVRVTNTTGAPATLWGWIDYNANGVFENATERTSVTVPSGSNNALVTLVFPAVQGTFTGETFARFRLSTDAAAADPTGEAADGEVEDYPATITRPSNGTANPALNKKIASSTGGGPPLANGDMFGSSVAAIGDLDGDGVPDMAVGTPVQFGAASGGKVYVMFMNADGTVKSSQEIASGVGGGPALMLGDYFGHSVAAIGDLDGDGIGDLAVGADKDDTGGYSRGAVHLLFMNTDGTVKAGSKIANNTAGGPVLANGDRFGSSLTSLGDLDGDGVADLAVGATGDGPYSGAVHVLLMRADGTVKFAQKIASGVGDGPVLADFDEFGVGAAALGDIDGDGITDLAVGAFRDDTGGIGRGAVYVLFMNANGTVKGSQKIASGIGGGPVLADGDYFGRSVGSLGDLDGDGINDLAVGAYRDDAGGTSRGALHVLFLNANGTVKRAEKIAHLAGGGPTLANDDRFGSGVAAIGDLNGDGVVELAVGAETDRTGGIGRGAVHVLFLNGSNTNPVFTSPAAVNVPENSTTVMTVIASDADFPPQGITYTIIGGADQARFVLAGTGALSFVSAPNFEAPTDADGDNVYVVTVQANDNNGGIATQTISVTVTPVNDNTPVITSPDTANVAENTTVVMTVTATDADLPPQAVTFSIAGGADQTKFTITPAGALSFVAPPDFEVPTDANGDNTYAVIVQASDGGLTSVQAILVTVTPVNDISPAFTSPTNVNVPENTTTITTVTAIDPDLPPQTITFSIVGGADQALFAITSAGELSFLAPHDFEAPADADGNNVYVVTVQADDGQGRTTTQTMNVTVSPVNDNNPMVTSPDTVSVPENTTSVQLVTASDADLPPQTITFSIVGGADQSKFTITPAGALSFVAAPDFESPADTNGDNIYVVIVQASDGSLTGLQAILVTVTNVVEPPFITRADFNGNGVVDAADYVLWRNQLGQSVPTFTGADGDGNGIVNQADYNIWRANFGVTSGSGAGVGVGAVIEVTAAPPAEATAQESIEAPPSSLALGATVPTLRPQTPNRPLRRSTLTAALHDNALVAWLTTRPTDSPHVAPIPLSDWNLTHGDSDDPDQPIDALDLAFATL